MVPSIKKKPKEYVKQKLREKKKLSKQILKEKRARLVVKNLPFATTQENLKEYFEKFGEVADVELLKKPDGKLVGCGFVQFKLVQKAAKARHHTNGKPFLGREILVDFAQSKKKYTKKVKKDETEVKKEIIGDDIDAIKKETEDDDSQPIEIKDEEKTNEYSDSQSSNDEVSEEDDIEEVYSEEKRPHVISNDVTEGRTIFIKNVPFQATNEDLKQCMCQFGPMFYALICVDKLTEHSKGTAFVKFINKEDAEKALNAGTELTLMGNVLDCHPALERNELQNRTQIAKEQKQKPKDSRNLYLVKEGVILAGSKAAEGVSASDMAKRLQIEQYKTQMLRNLNMFVSRDRLVVYNLPASWDDKKLRILLQKHGGADAVIKEARVMRDMRNLDAQGIGKSKEYGFVKFTRHENALTALRSLNNNPNIFSANKRPIVTFSIENKAMIKAKQKRLEKSRMYNPKSKDYNAKVKSEEQNTKRKFEEENVEDFAGVTARPGVQQKMRSRYKLNVQAKLHHENLMKEKKRKKSAKKTLEEKKRDFIKQPKQKINKKANKEHDNFSKLVHDYKQKILNASPVVKKAKWFE